MADIKKVSLQRTITDAFYAYDIERLKVLLELDEADVNGYIEENQTFLRYACENNMYEIVELLLKRGAKTTCLESEFIFETPLEIVCKYGFFDIGKLLLNHGVNPNYYVEFSPFDMACEHGNVHFLKLLLDRGFKFENGKKKNKMFCDKELLDKLIDQGFDPETQSARNAKLDQAIQKYLQIKKMEEMETEIQNLKTTVEALQRQFNWLMMAVPSPHIRHPAFD